MKPILYNYFRSSASYRVRIALHLKQIEFEYRAINLLKNEQNSPAYLTLNPKGEVPYFVDGEVKLTQSLVICDYLDFKSKVAPLFPFDARKRWKALEICELIGAGIQPLQNLIVMNQIAERFGANDEAKGEWNRYFVERGLNALEELLKSTAGRYCIGDEFSAADVFLVPQIFSANRFKVDVSKYPTIEHVNRNCSEHDAVKRAHPSKQVDFVA
jgi:maleylacetoacetate isomerase